MNRSFSKRRHIEQVNILAERRYLNEQTQTVTGLAGVDEGGNKWLYDGEVLDGKPNGKGKKVKDFGYFEGQFNNGKEVEGTFVWTSGDYKGHKYTGQFNGPPFHGKGVYTWPEGDKIEGQWVNGLRQGPFLVTLPDGTTHKIQIKDGNVVGPIDDPDYEKPNYDNWLYNVVKYDENYVYVPTHRGDNFKYRFNKKTERWEVINPDKPDIWIDVDPSKKPNYKLFDEKIRKRYDEMIQPFLDVRKGPEYQAEDSEIDPAIEKGMGSPSNQNDIAPKSTNKVPPVALPLTPSDLEPMDNTPVNKNDQYYLNDLDRNVKQAPKPGTPEYYRQFYGRQ